MRAMRWALACSLIPSTLLAAGGAHYHKIRARCSPGVATHAYQPFGVSPPVSALSQSAVLILRPAGPMPPASDGLPGAVAASVPAARFYQLATPALGIDHCRLTRVSLALFPDGRWMLSALAEQNAPDSLPPFAAPTLAQPVVPDRIRDEVLQTGHIRRNLFIVKARCLAASPLAENVAGRAVVAGLAPAPFWVQRGSPHDLLVEGRDPRVAALFDVIDRVEIDFSYH